VCAAAVVGRRWAGISAACHRCAGGAVRRGARHLSKVDRAAVRGQTPLRYCSVIPLMRA
jgi:hypothetical protein